MPEYRLRYVKQGSLRYISHLDLMRTFERAFRRAALPVAYTEGFHPHPKVGLGPALSLGVESTAEYMDLTLTEEIEPAKLIDRLNPSLPPELHVSVVNLISPTAKPLTAVINRATYTYNDILGSDIQSLESVLRKLWEQSELLVSRRAKDKSEKQVNIRPLWHDWKIEGEADYPIVVVEYEIGNNGSVRPEELINFLPAGITIGKITRTNLWVVNERGRFLPDDFER